MPDLVKNLYLDSKPKQEPEIVKKVFIAIDKPAESPAPAPSASPVLVIPAPKPSSDKENQRIINPVLPAPKPLKDKEVTDKTALLWKYNPVPENEPEATKDFVCCTQKFLNGEFIAARVRGKKHKHNGTNCDDWFEIGSAGQIVFAAVSDGAGSKRLSRIGAKYSCQSAVYNMRQEFNKLHLSANPPLLDSSSPDFSELAKNEYGKFIDIVKNSVKAANQSVKFHAQSCAADPDYCNLLGREPELKDFSATLLVAAFIPLGDDGADKLVITCQIGDGMMALLKTSGEFDKSLRLMGDPDTGEFSGETDFLTSLTDDMLDRKTKIAFSDADLFFMMSDGVADDYFPNNPEIIRLYYDLILNSVLDGVKITEMPLTADEINIARKLLYEPNLTDSDSQKLNALRSDYEKKHRPEKMLKSLAISYPALTANNQNQSVKIPIQYTNRICEGLSAMHKRKITIKDLWSVKDREILSRIRNNPDPNLTEKEKILALWLDNYTVRSSADDRTLVIIKFSNGEIKS